MNIAELRELIGSSHPAIKKKTTFSLFDGGFSLGSIIEISGQGKTELVSQFLKENKDLKAAWLEKQLTINPYGLFQKGVRLENILFIETREELLWSITQSLQSGCFQVLVTHGHHFTEKELRRFQLYSEKNESHFFLLSEKRHNSWVPHLQLEVSKKQGCLNIQITRKRSFS